MGSRETGGASHYVRLGVSDGGIPARHHQERARRRSRTSKAILISSRLALLVLAGWIFSRLLPLPLVRDMWQTVKLYRPPSATKQDPVDDTCAVRPLIDSTSTFDVQATVWFDVTEHLDLGYTLPNDIDGKPYRRVKYNSSNTEEHTDIILYSDVLFRNVTRQTTLYAKLPLRIPSEPLYTQILGPTTLRITYQIRIPEPLPQLGSLKYVRSVFPHQDVTHPRSLDPFLQHALVPDDDQDDALEPIARSKIRDAYDLDTTSAESTDSSRPDPIWSGKEEEQAQDKITTTAIHSMEQALAHTGGGDGLLIIVPSSYKTSISNCTLAPNLEWLPDGDPFFLDNASRFQTFTTQMVLDDHLHSVILGDDCSIYVPHLKTRTSLFMKTFEDSIAMPDYLERQDARADTMHGCWSLDDPRRTCASVKPRSLYDNMLVFTGHSDEQSKEETGSIEADYRHCVQSGNERPKFRYAPQIFHGRGSAGPYHLRTLPRIHPKAKAKANGATENSAKEDACQIPLLEHDETKEFFTPTIDVRFAFASSEFDEHFYSYIPVEAYSGKFKEVKMGEDIRIRTSTIEHSIWLRKANAIRDEEHRRSRSFAIQLASQGHSLLMLPQLALSLLYWYTRSGTEGLSTMVIKLYLAVHENTVAMHIQEMIIYRAFKIGPTFLVPVLFILLQLPLLVRVRVAPPLRGQTWYRDRLVRRPPSRREKESNSIDKMFGTWKPVAFAASFTLLRVVQYRHTTVLRKGYGCLSHPFELQPLMSVPWYTVERYIEQAAQIIQLAFNVFSPRFSNARPMRHTGKTGSYGGSFKLSAWLQFTSVLIITVGQVDHLRGYSRSRDNLTLGKLIDCLVMSTAVIQTIIYPGIPVDPNSDFDEDEGLD